MQNLFLTIFIIIATNAISQNHEIKSQWRGVSRNGIYHDKNLLKSWPESGPELAWSFEGLGAGHGSVAIANDKIFVLGMPDTTGVIYAFDLKNGNLLWQKEYGTEWHLNFKGTRSTPTVVDNLVYFMSGQGVVFCYDGKTGEKVWSVDILKTFGAENIKWGITESLVIDGVQLFCTPGGSRHNVVSLNRFTGNTIWTSPAMGELSAYCSPLLINHNGTKLLVTATIESIICIDAVTGDFYWSIPQKQGHKINANTPVYWRNNIYFSGDYAPEDNGLVAISLSNDGRKAQVLWRNQKYTNLMGSIILKNGFIIGSEYKKKGWSVIDATTGELIKKIEQLGSGVVIWADDRYYGYTEDGKMYLIDAGLNHFNIVGSFSVPLGTDQHWSHPVIHNKMLYVRHGNALMVYKIGK